eukprot:gnl/Spiro4/8433_TR4427_c0_g1_i3.p2 gnl/Spiro4/8433_TR4427_c0_g1~~gnl/Spiro4/8433_TR4427_c0_g1_i3.p2  ORF type:complete len:136 (+),score=30.99 gnl/Spiro4/8433_TR4427_c0_g1_i3:522-929(+)
MEVMSSAKWNIHNRITAALSRLHQHQDAQRTADSMIAADPTHPKGYVRKAGALFFQGKYNDALHEYAKALERIPEAERLGTIPEGFAVKVHEYANSARHHANLQNQGHAHQPHQLPPVHPQQSQVPQPQPQTQQP